MSWGSIQQILILSSDFDLNYKLFKWTAALTKKAPRGALILDVVVGAFFFNFRLRSEGQTHPTLQTPTHLTVLHFGMDQARDFKSAASTVIRIFRLARHASFGKRKGVATLSLDPEVPHNLLPVATVGRVVAAILRERWVSVLDEVGDFMRHRVIDQVVPSTLDLEGGKVEPQLARSGLRRSRRGAFKLEADRRVELNPVEFLRTLNVELDLLGDFDFGVSDCHAEP